MRDLIKGKVLSLDAYKQATVRMPDVVPEDFELTLEILYYNTPAYKKALRACKQAIKLNPTDAEAYCKLGDIESGNPDRQISMEAYKQAIRLKPDLAEAHFGLGCILDGLGRDLQAIVACKRAIRVKPDYTLAHYKLGMIFSKLGCKSSALKEHEILKNLDLENADYLLNEIYR
jgi:tetratricopeptide (TPR) repeat protein